jgi:hypothetical protein
VKEESSPCLPETIIVFHARKDIAFPDLSSNGNGATGGDNGRGWMLPPIVYPPAPIDTSEGKVSGGKRGQIMDDLNPDSADNCVTDSREDLEDSDDHKLVQFAQAIHKEQPVIIAIRGQFKGYQDQEIEVLFQRDYEGPPPTDILEPWAAAMQEIVALSAIYCSEGIPNSCMWAQPGTPREHMDIALSSLGKG